MADRLVVNCDAQLAASLFREADEWAAKGDALNEQKALDAARAQLELAGLDSREVAEAKACERVPLTAAERAERTRDAADAVARFAEQQVAAQAEGALRAKLAAGTASPAEVQQAIVRLLGG